jgi:hypothetical protein
MQGLQFHRLTGILGNIPANSKDLTELRRLTGLDINGWNQQGSPVLPASGPFAGVSFKWNIQDLFSK